MKVKFAIQTDWMNAPHVETIDIDVEGKTEDSIEAEINNELHEWAMQYIDYWYETEDIE